jgi:4-hydroxy-3-polyprenylbenzoate decarboxylase
MTDVAITKQDRKYHLLLGVTGASGVFYTAHFIEKTKALLHLRLSVVFSKNAETVWQTELQRPLPQSTNINYWDISDFSAPFASGSNHADAMIILPCSMGTISRIAHGVSDNLITRAADVQLKERRPLVIVPRESPYNLIHLRNLTQLCEAGAVIVPASPSFYHRPDSIEALIDPFVERLLLLCGAVSEYEGVRWGS